MTTRIHVLALPGTGHPNGGDGVTEAFLSTLDHERFVTKIVPYPATFGGLETSFNVSRDAGRQALVDAILACEGAPVVLAGYSQGAVIAGDLAYEAVRDNRTEWNIVGCALIADGYRPAGVGVVPEGNTMAEGYGIAGQRFIPDDLFPTWWVSAWGDPIAALPAGNPLRTVADLVGWYSLRTPEEAAKWGTAMLDTVNRRRLQDWWAPWKWAGWAGALAFLRGFLFDGRHGRDYLLYDYCHALGMAVNKGVKG